MEDPPFNLRFAKKVRSTLFFFSYFEPWKCERCVWVHVHTMGHYVTLFHRMGHYKRTFHRMGHYGTYLATFGVMLDVFGTSLVALGHLFGTFWGHFGILGFPLGSLWDPWVPFGILVGTFRHPLVAPWGSDACCRCPCSPSVENGLK